ncbi:MAG TPA: hypothetical protein VGR62_16585 [Candidatus Binatia bacterium]|jgi:hypothetical protein|nr:hypothetical protein [Candidatus Binatia bacterium]
MPKELLIARTETGTEDRFVLTVEQAGTNWTSTLTRLDETGTPEPTAAAPRFYGLTQDQARRRMLQILDPDYEEIESHPA